MSWLKKRNQNNIPSVGQQAEQVPMFNPNQWQPNNWYPQHQTSTQQQNYWEQAEHTDQQNQQQSSQSTQFQQQYHAQNMVYNPIQPQPNQQTYGNLQYSQQYNTQNNSFQSVPLQNNETDSWGNWGWGDEDNSNLQSTQSKHLKPSNDLASNFTNEESWNWSVDDPNSQRKDQNLEDDIPSKDTNELFPKMGKQVKIDAQEQDDIGELAITHPVVSISKRNKLETPQWSMDSQISQESSDDILQTSESDNHLVSSSTVSHSPLSGLDNLQPMKEDVVLESASPSVYQHNENREIIKNNSSPSLNQVQQAPQTFSSIPSSASGFPQEDAPNMYKRTSQKVNQFNLRQNAYQQTFSQGVNLETVPDNCEHPDVPLTSTGKSLVMPNIQRAPNHHQNWQDNNEVPMNDRNQYLETGQLSDSKNLNFPSETESAEHRPTQEDALPPPGLRRMVLGQMEHQETAGNSENCNDEPPPGLSRMVLGQNENNTNNTTVVENNANNSFEPISPPEGLRRMVPGESSSPENSLRQPTFQSEATRIDDSDREFRGVPQLRSATIGADTPPATTIPIASQTNLSTTNRSETIGGADSGEKIKASNVSPASGRKMGRKTKEKKFDNQRRDFIEGQQLDSEVASMTSGVRNLTVGDISTDDGNEANSKPEPRRKLSRQDTSESENDKRSGKSPRDKKDRRYKSDKRERDQYSPEPSKDRRYDRRKYRDRHYDDNVDYLSDRDHDKDTKDRDQEKKYYSLRKDKEKDRRRRESPREYERNNRRKREEYYHRYDDSYVEDRSRPSSRSDSMHDSMYRGSKRGDNDGRDRRRDRDKHRRIRDPYNPYAQGYSGFDPYSPYYQQYQYQYYENLRRTNPQAYAEIYRKYYDQHSSRHPPAFGTDDRSSVHSGRSSANDELKDSFSRSKDQTDYLLEDSVKSGRVTPAKFITSHTKASIGSGRFVKVLPNYPQDGQLALVELAPLEVYLQKDDEFKELSSYPGPLIKDVTHKKTVIEYCENKIRSVNSNFEISDPESYVLLWEFLILLLRQNGKVVGTDIAELLLKKRTDNLPVRPPSVLSNLSGTTGDIPPISESSNPQLSEGGFGNSLTNFKEEEITNKFREYLLYGSGQEALEWAMKHGLWGHALFLASKLGKRTYSNVMVRFANGLTLNDPLQTLYQLLSGRIPAVVSGVADEKWGDWRPHLAMMLSNSSLQPELNRKAIMSLGDTLMSRGSLYAAQFCYLMAEVDFGRYGADNVKMVLLGSSHAKPFLHFATNEAIHMTEIYEYACSLNDPEFTMPELQVYKYLLATRLADRGLLEKSLAYLEKISLYIINNPSNVQSSLVNNVCNLADRLKYYDPNGVEDDEDNTTLDQRLDNSWLKHLKTVQEKVSCGLIPTLDNYNDRTLVETVDSNMYSNTVDQSTQEAWQQSNFYGSQYQNDTSQLPWQTEQQPQLDPSMELYQQTEQQQIEGYSSLSYQEQQPQQYWSAPQQPQPWESNVNPEHLDQDQSNYYEQLNTQNEDEPRQQITIPNQSKGKSIFDDEPLPHEKKEQNKKSPSNTDISQKKNSSGWFGGIFSKLALKPKNQMKLPDDKNPSIVWDQEKKKWVNVDEDNNVASSDLKPPPKISNMKTATTTKPPLPPQVNSSNSLPQGYTNPHDSFNGNVNNIPQPTIENSQPPGFAGQDNVPPQQGNNMFKLQKNRNLKKSYIDVFNPGGATKQTISTPSLASFPTPNTSQMNFFVPQLVDDPNAPTNFLTQATPVIQLSHDDSTQGRH